MSIIMDDGVEMPETDQQLQEFLSREEFVHYAGALMPKRPGVLQCIRLLERRHYESGTSRNDMIFMRIIRWCDMVWLLVSVPVEEQDLLEDVVRECGLKIFRMAPTFIGSKGISRFPADNDRVSTLENSCENPVYCSNFNSN